MGNLSNLISKSNTVIPLNVKVLIALDSAQGMNFLHKSNILHRDFKCDNLLVISLDPNAPVRVKLTDFGESREKVKGIPYNNLTSI